MAALNSDQRNAIVRRCAGLIATYFARSPLRMVDLDLSTSEASGGVLEFHDYLRLSALLPAGKELCEQLARVVLAPAAQQTTTTRFDRGILSGPIDPSALYRRFGQRTVPREFPVRRIATDHAVPENVVAASSAWALLSELQLLMARTKLPPASSEAILATEIIDAVQAALAEQPLSDLLDQVVDLRSLDLDLLLRQVEERWRLRRISNRAYAEIARWCQTHRVHRLAPDGLLDGVSYGEDFDNRLFEIFALSIVRSGMETLGFEVTTVRPLHLAGGLPVAEFAHGDSGISVDLYFQRSAGVAWTESSPRAWLGIAGIPDLILASRSPSHPLILVDAKNRSRGSALVDDEDVSREGRHATSEELHKMLGYFSNFGRRCVVGGRGPVGGLIFSSATDGEGIWITKSDREGLLSTIATNPGDPALDLPDGPARKFVEVLLRSAGLLGGSRPDGTAADLELAQLHADIADDPNDADQGVRAAAISAWVEDSYGSDLKRTAEAERILSAHVLGTAVGHLTPEELLFVTTAEIFWEDHADAVKMDFGPVVLELAKVVESLVNRTLVDPFRAWATAEGREAGKLDTLGDQRAELNRVASLQANQNKPRGARSLSDYLHTTHSRLFVLGELMLTLNRLNPIRRQAAHPHKVTSRVALEVRGWLLGVGAEPSALARIASELSASNP